MSLEDFSGRILLRIAPELHQMVAKCAGKNSESVNAFITETLEERVEVLMNITAPAFTRFVLQDSGKVIRDAAIVTQDPWFMDLFNTHKVYFYNRNLGRITPMNYLLCYETTKTESDGMTNVNARHVRRWGKVKEIIFDLSSNDFVHIPELMKLTQDQKFWPIIKDWDLSNVVILEEVGSFQRALPLRDWKRAKFLQNKSSSLVQVRNAEYIEDLYS